MFDNEEMNCERWLMDFKIKIPEESGMYWVLMLGPKKTPKPAILYTINDNIFILGYTNMVNKHSVLWGDKILTPGINE